MNILIVKLSAIGDVVHTLPSLKALRTLYPDAHITWIVEEASSDILYHHPDLDRVIVSYRKRWIKDLKKFKNIKSTFAEIRTIIKKIRDRRYDLVIDFHGLFKSALFVFLSGGKRKLGYDSMQELNGLFLTDKIYEDMQKHAVERYLDLIRYAGYDGPVLKASITIEPEDQRRVLTLLDKNHVDINEPFVTVSPVALWDTKLWNNEKFAHLCDRISSELKVAIILTGNRKEGRLTQIESLMEYPVVNLGSSTTLRELAYLYSLSKLLITTDSGPMHIAAAVGTPTIALFGPTDPGRTGPYGNGHLIIRRNVPCSPCFLKSCNSMKCMNDISVEEVLKAVQNKLKGV